jgi:FkbM family methyltransferase
MAGIVTEFFHRFKFLRTLAKKIFRYRTIRQPFYSGFIFFNAVDYSFLWTNHARAEHHDRFVQDALLNLSKDRELFIDIGSNIGLMTLTVALRNQDIRIQVYDPNSSVLNYLRKSLVASGINNRVEIINAAVSDFEGKAFMNFSKGSYAGHLSEQGVEVPVKNFKTLLEDNREVRAVFKMDIEGFEKLLIPLLVADKNPKHAYVIEMHPPGMNRMSDPDTSLALLFAHGFAVSSVKGERISSRSQIEAWDNIICYYEES